MSTFSAIGGIPVAQRVSRFSYAIRNIVDAAYAEEARGRTVRYLNIGDPAAFGFNAPPHMIEAVSHALRNNQNGYLPSVGVLAAREAVAAEYTRKGLPIGAERVIITQGSSEGIDLALTALVNEGEEVLVPSPSYPLYTAVLATLGAKAVYYPSDPTNDWLPDLDRLRDLVTSRTRALVIIDPNNPTGAVYPESLRRAMIDFADSYGLTILADEVYGELGFEGPVPLLGSLAPEAPILSFSSLSKAWLTPGWRTGWLVASPTSRLDGVLSGVRKLADARLCSPGPMQYAVPAALNGDRSHQQPFREALAERARIVVDAFSTIPGGRCVPPRAAFYAMPSVPLPPGRTDEEYVLALLRETGILCVHGSGFGVAPDAGCLRIVFLADPRALIEIGREIADFTAHYMETAQLPTGLGTGDH